MPQTREHLEILRLLGPERRPGRPDQVRPRRSDLARPGRGRRPESGRRDVPRRGGRRPDGGDDGPGDRRPQGQAPANSATRAPTVPTSGLFRMAIDRSFTVSGHGTIVTGTVASGVGRRSATTSPGSLRADPSGSGGCKAPRPAGRPRGPGGEGGDQPRRGPSRRGPSGGRAGDARLPRGLRGSSRVEVTTSPDAPRSLKHRGRYRVHLGTAEVAATLSILAANTLGPGSTGLAQLFLAGPVAAVHGQPFVIREESPPGTLGGGRVLRPTGPRIRRIRRRGGDRPAGPAGLARPRASAWPLPWPT